MDELGFWHALFQSDSSRQRVKVWFDGDENYALFKQEEFYALGKESGMTVALRSACRDSSFFLWDVEHKTITRVRFNQPPESLRKEIVPPTPATDQQQTAADRYWKTDIELDDKNGPKFRS